MCVPEIVVVLLGCAQNEEMQHGEYQNNGQVCQPAKREFGFEVFMQKPKIDDDEKRNDDCIGQNDTSNIVADKGHDQIATNR